MASSVSGQGKPDPAIGYSSRQDGTSYTLGISTVYSNKKVVFFFNTVSPLRCYGPRLRLSPQTRVKQYPIILTPGTVNNPYIQNEKI